MNVREQMFQKVAKDGLNQLLTEMVKQYKPKKGQRFNASGVTYEIGVPNVEKKGISFEISSKIPIEDALNKEDLKKYFSAVKKIMTSQKEKTFTAEMENIIRTDKKNLEKDRDYVKLRYLYPYKELFNEKEIGKKLTKGTEDFSKIPDFPGVVTIGGRLVLASIKDTIYNKCKASLINLIDANTKVKNDFKINES